MLSIHVQSLAFCLKNPIERTTANQTRRVSLRNVMATKRRSALPKNPVGWFEIYVQGHQPCEELLLEVVLNLKL